MENMGIHALTYGKFTIVIISEANNLLTFIG